MKKLFAWILALLLLVVVIGHFLYPVLSDQLARRRDAEMMQEYREKTSAMGKEQREKLFAEAAEWNKGLEEIRMEDIFTAGITRTTRDYQNHMNVHSGIIAELVIPDIGVSLPVYHLSTETPATYKLVHVNTSSLPADGSGENIVLAGPGVLKTEGFPGKLGLTDDRMLEELDRLIPGNLVVLNVLDRTMVYRVKGVQMLSPAGLKELDLTPDEGEEKLTLVSQRKDQRLLIQAERIPIREARTLLAENDQATFPSNWQNVLLLGCPVLIAGLLVLWIIELIRGRFYRLPDEGKREDPEQLEKALESMDQISNEINEVEES
ncbi:MAG: sortase [Clostridia bacterium]|nr:sortase [Clostridia bacterium]